MPNIVKGLINQLTTRVTVNPLGFLNALTMLPKSILSIMGKIMIQIRRAMGMDTLAYSSRPKVSGTMGNHFPMAMPARMHNVTQRVR